MEERQYNLSDEQINALVDRLNQREQQFSELMIEYEIFKEAAFRAKQELAQLRMNAEQQLQEANNVIMQLQEKIKELEEDKED